MVPRRGTFWLCAALLGIPGSVSGDAAEESPVVRVFREAAPAIVRVQAALQSDVVSGKAPTRLICSGVFITQTGRVLTFSGEHNELARASRIWIEKDGMPYLADLIGSDPRAKIALLQVVKLPGSFATITMPTAADRAPVGSAVIAVTSPLSIDEPSPSTGVIAGYESNFGENIFPFTYARVTIPSGDAESGSPVFDYEGRLIGISVASLPQFSSSYLVPTAALLRLVADFDATGRSIHSSLPIECDEHPDASNVARQVVITKVRTNSSASQAGLRIGDIVRRIDGVNIRRLHDYRDAVFFSRVGQYLQFEIERDGRLVSFVLPVEADLQESKPITAPPPLISSPQPTGAMPAVDAPEKR